MPDRYVDISSGILDLEDVQCAFREDRQFGPWWKRRTWPVLLVFYHGNDDELEFVYRDEKTRDDAHYTLLSALNSYADNSLKPNGGANQ